ncbi:MAG: S9 family peptidase [Acidobacteriaceae bacterium]|nr:S9 family peptidase [Acidobacteriaceae bacterium]
MPKSGWVPRAVALCALACAARSSAQESKIDRVLQQLEAVHEFSAVTISPNGQWLTWAESPKDGRGTELFLMHWKEPGAKPVRISAGESTKTFEEHGVSWSPDSTRLAFFSNAASEQEQVFVMPVKGGRATQLTHVNGYVTDIRWSPDGRQLAFLYAEGGGGGGPLEAEPAQTGVIEGQIHNQRIAVVSSSGGELKQLSPANLNIYEYDWHPGGRLFAAIAAPGPADNNWWIAQLYVLDADSQRMKAIYRPPVEQQIAVPRWSPDGKQIAFIGGLMSDQGFDGGDLFLLPAEGGDARNLTPGMKASPSGFKWQTNHTIVVTEELNGGGAIATLSVDSGEQEVLWKGSQDLHEDGNFPNFALAKDGRTSAAIRSTWEKAPEVDAGPIGEWHDLTHANSDQNPQWGQAESLTWEDEGVRVQGWLLYPDHYDAAKRYPMVVEIHGGPSNLKSAHWPSTQFDMSAMAALGYFVFFPNPRGSYGEGEAFTRANIKDFGGGDLRDVLAGVDAVLGRVPVDPNRIGVTGWSYGGFMTMWTVTQTNRFKAAVAGAGIADWLSYYGENAIDEWMIPFFGASVYDDPAVYAKSSPITFIKQVKTPTLVLVGERDAECPSPQSFEFWHALKTLGVPTELVVYAGEGHGFHDPKDRLDRMRRTLGWFDQYLSSPGSGAATAAR